MEGLISHLPEDMAVEIMSWLPADSLLRFKLVSKSWHAFISDLVNDPPFVAKHLSNAKTTASATTSLLFAHFCPHVDHTGTPDCGGDVFSLITISSGPVSALAEELDLPPPRPEAFDRLGRWRVAGHCDGIVCLIQDPQTIVLCNPTSREIRALPRQESANSMGTGFGYDPRARDYKFVKIFDDRFDRARVYTLGTDSWRVIDMPLSEHILEVIHRDGLFRRGVCYWLVQDFWYNKMILCFDMSDEEFYVVKLPALNDTVSASASAGLTVWNDSVALFVFLRDHDSSSSSIEIFVLEDRNAFSWTRQPLIGPLVDIANTFSFVHGDEFLLQATDKRLLSYNVRTRKLSDVAVSDVDRLRHWSCFYVKSLVSVRRR